MYLPLSVWISLRFRHSCRSSRMVSIIYIFSIVGISLGIAVLIVGLSAVNGFERELKNRILAVVPHGEVESVIQPWNNWSAALIKIEKLPGIVAAVPYINFTGLIECGKNLRTLQIKGVNPNQEERLSALSKFVQNNAWSKFRAGKRQIIIGKGVADALKVREGDWVSIIISNTSSDYNLQQPKRVRLNVTGIFQLSGQLDHSFAVVPMDDARQYLDIGDSVTGIAIKVSDVFNANEIAYAAGKVTNNYVYIKSWIDTYGYMYHDIKMIRTIMYLVMILVISVACFNIVSTLMIAVKNRSSDIAVLRTLGARDSFIRFIFIWYAILVWMFGSLIGVVIGVLVSLRLTHIFNEIEKLISHQFLPGSIYFVDFLPSELYWTDVFYVSATALSLSLLASWYPARRASIVNPAAILY